MSKKRELPAAIEAIKVELSNPKEDRIKDYIRQTGNPYLLCVGDVIVEMEYLACGRSLQDALMETMLYRNSNISASRDSTKL